jgi:hypothetical protein
MKMIAGCVGAKGSDSQTFSLTNSLLIKKQIYVYERDRRGWWGKYVGMVEDDIN